MRLVDELSNELCCVLDPAEATRQTHASAEWRQAADSTFQSLLGVMEELNTNSDIYRVLERSSAPEVAEGLTEEQRHVLAALKRDMEAHGQGMSAADKAKYRDLSMKMAELASQFSANNSAPATDSMVLPFSSISRIPPAYRASLRPGPRPDTAVVPLEPHLIENILRWSPDEETRRRAYLAFYRNPRTEENVAVLEQLLSVRRQLASLLGAGSYAHLQLRDSPLTDPEAACALIRRMADAARPRALQELADMERAKVQSSSVLSPELKPWDVAYLQGAMRAEVFDTGMVHAVSDYLTLPNVIEGLKLISLRVFGLRLEEAPLLEGETGAQAAIKLNATCARTGRVRGRIYLDLFRRPHKLVGSATFTIQCGRYLAKGEVPTVNDTAIELPGGAMQGYQMPIVLVSLSFPAHGRASQVPMFDAHELQTLFHEMGHALHHLLCETEFQHMAGTRAPIEFVEVPSQFMEKFAVDHRVLSQFARHRKSGKIIPEALVAQITGSRRRFRGWDTLTQSVQGTFDLTVHGAGFDGDTTAAYERIYNDIMPISTLKGLQWHARFEHLTNYAAQYYAYQYSKVVASALWHRGFADDPLRPDSQAAARWRRVLSLGGARPSPQLLSLALGGGDVATALDDYLNAAF